MKFLARLCAVLLCLTLVSSCFVPDNFETELRITKDGSYGITYIGVLTYAPLFGQIARGAIDEQHAKDNERMMMEQLKRDDGFKQVTSLGKGRYQVRYERTGRFAGAHQQVTFVSRQEPIFRVRTTESATVEVNGSGQGKLYAKQLGEVGLKTQGLFRVVTDAEVTESNAQFKRQSPAPGFTIYDWRIRDFTDIPPHLSAKLAVDPRTGVPAYSGGKGVNVEQDDGKR
ncbi:MAG: hypothetical protein K1X51_04385 [Rhodospirillaceae bacterium]|nr:hypothetical protein [Rhodospirillaceae bacterium]